MRRISADEKNSCSKKLKVPFLPQLDKETLENVTPILELQGERESIDRLNWRSTFPYKPIVVVTVARGESELYLHYFVRGLSIKALADRDGVHVHEDSCVEFFMRKEGDSGYTNFEFNCIGTCFACRGVDRHRRTTLTKEEYEQIRRYTTLGQKPFKEVTGIHSWELIVAIPFKLMELDGAQLPEKIYGNFYNCADKTENPHYVTWNPIKLPMPDYHAPDFFGEIYF